MTDNILVVTALPAPGGQEDMGVYLNKVMPLLQGAGGQLIGRYRIAEIISGGPGFAMVMVMRFEDADTIRNLFASESYKALIEVRTRAFSKIDITIADDGV